MCIGKSDAFPGQPVQVRRGHLGLEVITAHVAVAEIVGQDEENIGLGRLGFNQKEGANEGDESGHAWQILAL